MKPPLQSRQVTAAAPGACPCRALAGVVEVHLADGARLSASEVIDQMRGGASFARGGALLRVETCATCLDRVLVCAAAG